MLNNNLLRSLHRDLGYLFIGVTLIYSVTGFILSARGLGWFKEEYSFKTILERNVAIENFKENLIYEAEKGKLDYIYTTETQKALKININRLSFIKKENNRLYFEYAQNLKIIYNVIDGKTDIYYKAYPPYIEIFIRSHLSTNNNIWYYLAMIYSIVLAFFAFSGIVIVRGKHSFKKRGVYLTAIGVFTIFIFLYFSFYNG